MVRPAAPRPNGLARPVHLIAGNPRARSRGADPLFAAALAQAGRPQPSVAYVGAASDDDREFLHFLTTLLQHSGAGDVRLAALASARADIAAAAALLEGSDVVFVSGGDVEAGMAHLERSGLIPLLERLHRGGKAFVGLSAGSIMLSRCWVRWADPDDDATAAVFPCLGLAEVLCDCHSESDGWEELRALLQLIDGGVGYGIPAGGALRVDPDGSVSALGKTAQRFVRGAGGVVGPATDLAPR